MAFDKKEIVEQLKLMELQGELQVKLNDSAAIYANHMLKISELQKNITHISKTLTELEAEKVKIVVKIGPRL
jgi:ABC-type phosphate transport system auxiliary subunit